MIKNVHECDYCQDQVNVTNVANPELPEGWVKILIMITDHTGKALDEMHYDICGRHDTIPWTQIIGTAMA